MSFNKIAILGNLGRDVELRYTPQGKAVANINIATTEKRRDNTGEYNDVTTWFRVTLWAKQAETAAKYLKKGSQVYLEGRLTTEEWTDRDGNTRTTLCVNGSDMQFVSGTGNGNGAARSESAADDGEDFDGDDQSGDDGDDFDAPPTKKAPAPKKSAPAKKAPAKKSKPAPVEDEVDEDF